MIKCEICHKKVKFVNELLDQLVCDNCYEQETGEWSEAKKADYFNSRVAYWSGCKSSKRKNPVITKRGAK